MCKLKGAPQSRYLALFRIQVSFSKSIGFLLLIFECNLKNRKIFRLFEESKVHNELWSKKLHFSQVYIQCEFLEYWNTKKVFGGFDNIFHIYLMRGFQKYERNRILMMALWVTCKIAQPIQPFWQPIFALHYCVLKKSPWEFN